MINVIAVNFAKKLVNRNKNQGDGKNTAEEFRAQFLQSLDSTECWTDNSPCIEIDFSGVQKLSPSFADEAFGYFTQYGAPEDVKSKIIFKNMSKIQEKILNMELHDAYKSDKKNA